MLNPEDLEIASEYLYIALKGYYLGNKVQTLSFKDYLIKFIDSEPMLPPEVVCTLMKCDDNTVKVCLGLGAFEFLSYNNGG